MPMYLVDKRVTKSELAKLAEERFGDLVKAVVDVEKGLMTIGGELHADEEAYLLDQGSHQKDLWGINLYPHKSGNDFIEFDSVINLRPAQGNRSRDVDDPEIRKKIKEIVNILMEEQV